MKPRQSRGFLLSKEARHRAGLLRFWASEESYMKTRGALKYPMSITEAVGASTSSLRFCED